MTHRSLWMAPALLTLAACQSPGPAAPGFDARALAGEEARFAAHSMQHGMQPAFVEYMAADSILLRPHPVNGREYMRTRPNPPITLDWKSALTILSASGDIGLSTGPWIRRSKADPAAAPSWGQFFSIWRRQADGRWHVEFDHGISHAGHDGMGELLTAVDLPPAARIGSAPPESDFITLAAQQGAHAAYRRMARATTRFLRDEQAPLVGPAALAHANPAEDKFVWTHDKTVVSAGGDFAYALGKWTLPGATKDANGYYLRVWTVRDGAWVLAADIVTPNP